MILKVFGDPIPSDILDMFIDAVAPKCGCACSGNSGDYRTGYWQGIAEG